MRTCGVFRFCMCVVSDYCVLGFLLTDGDFDARHSARFRFFVSFVFRQRFVMFESRQSTLVHS